MRWLLLPLLLPALSAIIATPALCWSIPAGLPLPDLPPHALLLQSLWEQNKDSLSFCVGTRLSDAQALLWDSFPDPLPTGPPDDPVCSNATVITAHLCSPSALNFYLKFLLLTDNPEKLPSNRLCDVSSSSSAACAPGFFAALPAAAAPELSQARPHACCPGYICPGMLTCMIPCPLGAYCPRAWPADPPAHYLDAAAGPEDAASGLLPPQLQPKPEQQPADQHWCAPFAYKLRPGLGCGGADKWSIEPTEPFPRRWDWFSGSIFCPGGRFCPNTTTMLECTAGHYCKTGSSRMTPCPPMLGCPAGSEAPTDNRLGFVLVSAVFLALGLMWQATQLYNQLMRRLSSRERMKVQWNRQTIAPEITVVEDDDDAPQLHAPPPTARQTAAGGRPDGSGSTEGAATSLAAAAEQVAGSTGSSWLSLPARFGLFRRRSSRAGAADSSGGGDLRLSMPWASADDAAVPLLECDMHQAEELTSIHHLKVKAGRSSLDFPSQPASGHNDLISTGVHLSPGSMHSSRPESEATSAGAKFFRSQRGSHLSMASSSGNTDADCWGSSPRVQLDIGFEGLGLKLKACNKVVLSGVTGRLEHGRLAAVMGPSGAGKSSFLCALAGRAPYGILTGRITVNGRPDRLERHKRLVGYVPQSDTMYRTLTVEENLHFSACFRLPASTTPRQRLQVVAAAIDVLGLADVRHQLIGNEEVRGISGGQVKRVNVGLELVAEPSLLFLDEPTSGLDSTASKVLVQCLQRVAHGRGVTVAAVVHAPSFETFSLFDDLILLAKGGVTAYSGPQAGVQGYFESLGFEIPQHVNPADAFLDIIAGAIKPSTSQGSAAATAAPLLDFAACWQQHCRSEPLVGDAAVVAVAASSRRASEQGGLRQASRAPWAAVARLPHALLLGVTLLAASVSDVISGVRNSIAEQLRDLAEAVAASGRPGGHGASAATSSSRSSRPPGIVHQFSLVLRRAVLMRTREPLLVFIEYSIFALTGMFVGLMSDRGRGGIGSYVGNTVYSIVAIGMLATISGIKVFGGPDRLVFYREASTGLSKLAHFWALDTWSYVGMVLRCGVYLAMHQTFAQPRAVVWQLYVVTAAIYYSCQGQAFLLSQVLTPNAAQLTAAVSALINALVASKFSTSGALGLLNTISYARWGLEGFVIAEANRLTGVWLLARCADLAAFNYDVTAFWHCIKVLVGIGFGSRVAACLAMLTLHRSA